MLTFHITDSRLSKPSRKGSKETKMVMGWGHRWNYSS